MKSQRNVEYISPDMLKPHPKNSRIHSEKQIEKLQRSIREFGFAKPVIVDEEYTILAGHGAVLAAQLLATFIIMVTQYMPTVSAETQKAYDMLLGQNWIFTLGSLTAYLISQSLDVSVFHKIRDAYIKKHGSTKGGRWIWNNASTLTSQLVDTAIFCVIAFGVGFGWLWDNPQAVVNMVIGQYLVKACIALLDTPFFYFFTKRRSAEEDCCENTN